MTKFLKFHDFRIHNNSAHGKDAQIWMDGQKLRGVKQVDLFLGSNDANEIRITMIAGSINQYLAEITEPEEHDATTPIEDDGTAESAAG